MTKQEIYDRQAQIDDAVRIFRETLEKSDFDLHGIGVHHFNKIFSGKVSFNRKKDGNLRVSGELPSVMFKDECKGLPMKMSDWKIFPMVITLFLEDE